MSILITALIVIASLMGVTIIFLAVLAFATRNDPPPYTPEEDAAQIKYLEEYRRKNK
jgi:hypothetical protein